MALSSIIVSIRKSEDESSAFIPVQSAAVTQESCRSANLAAIAMLTAVAACESQEVKPTSTNTLACISESTPPQISNKPLLIHDFEDKQNGKVIPYGIYDIVRNEGWVSIGIDHETAAFAVASIAGWWERMGRRVYPTATELLITADAGGSNGYRRRAWKLELQKFADKSRLRIMICHFPPGTGKWNAIEHRMFCHITQNWRNRPLVSHQIIVNLISNTITSAGLSICAELDTATYPKGVEVSDDVYSSLQITPSRFHGEWNYSIEPRKP